MAIKLVDELQAMGNFPIAHAEGINLVKEDGTEDNLQNLFNNGELGGGGDSSRTLTQEEYEALPEEERLNGLYYTYDTKRIYKNGVQYGASEPIPLTMEEYKTLKEAGAIDEQQEYLVEADAEGILLGAEDIGYNNAESGIQATTVQGAIDKVAEIAESPIKPTLDIALAENDCDNIPSLMEDLTIVVCTVSGDIVAHTPKDTFPAESGFFEITTTRQNSTYAWQTAKKLAEKSNIFQRCLLNGVWSDWTSTGSIRNEVTNDVNTWSSSKIASEISAKVTKTLYRGSRSIDIYTGGKLTLIYSSEYASQAGCYMLLSNFNTVPLLIELGRNDIGQFKVTATHKSENVDTITVTTAGDEYSWYVLQF